ncbi:MAG: alcohol dehydrogenase catalytic domain-containing protein [Hyphomicrobiales bacterium]|nr:alcohol dehydrogenase catalytic domain-containing protein [Hyphomicrobiales bacterium]
MLSQSIIEYAQPLQQTTTQTPVPSGTEILLKISHCGVCHSDVHLHDGYFDFGGGKKLDIRDGRELPFTLGHEIGGEVVAMGEQANGVSVGDKVVAYPWIGCGECSSCKNGDENLCNKNGGKVLGVNAQGGFADYVIVPHSKYLLEYNNIPAGLAATYMCSGLTAYSALKKVDHPAPEDKILIVGLGGVGMMGLQFAYALFGRYPLAADVNEETLLAATKAGSPHVYNPKDQDSLRQLKSDSGGGVVAAVDFVGSESSFKFANAAVRKGGTIVIVGMFGGALSMPLPLIPMRALTIKGSFVGNLREAKEMMALVRDGKVNSIPVEERPMNEAGNTLDDLRSGAIVGRVVLRP